MKEKLEQISKETIAKIQAINSMQELNDLRVKVLGKKGELTEILRGMKDLTPEERLLKEKKSLAQKMISKNRGTVEQIAEDLELQIEIVKELADLQQGSAHNR